MKELLENAVLSIELGVEDFEADEERRLLSAMRRSGPRMLVFLYLRGG